VDKEVFVAGSKHKAAAELQRILSQAVLLVSGGLGATAGLHVVSAQQVEQGSVAQADSFVRHTLVVDQEREVDAGFFAEEPCIAHVAQPDYRQMCAFAMELCFELAQLRDMLAAEDSTVVAKKDQDGRAAFPQRTKARGIAVSVR